MLTNLSVSLFCLLFYFSLYELAPFDQPEFMVGYGNKDYPGYHKLIEAQLLDRAIRQRLLEVHAQHAGFPIAEPTLVVKGDLCVMEGFVRIDTSSVTVVDKLYDVDLTVRDVFAAMMWDTKVAWTKKPPSLDDLWRVGVYGNIGDDPCLFIRSVPVRHVFPPSIFS
jgi:hypothetical protein